MGISPRVKSVFFLSILWQRFVAFDAVEQFCGEIIDGDSDLEGEKRGKMSKH